MAQSKRSGTTPVKASGRGVQATALRVLNGDIGSMQEQSEDLASRGGMDGAGCIGAGLSMPGARGRTALSLQKFRIDWESLGRASLCEVATFLAERHWFIRPVVDLNTDLYGLGFRFREVEGRDFQKIHRAYPFRRIHKDLLRDFMANQSAVAIWKRGDTSDGGLPVLEIPDVKDVDLLPGGVLKMRLRKVTRMSADTEERLGERMSSAMKLGKMMEIQPDDPDWAFRVITSGKLTSGLCLPSLTGILDDLDYIAAVKLGDWNGAMQRRKMIFQAIKGYGITSGSNAGQTRGHAKRAQLDVVSLFLKGLLGSASLATNFDQDFKHHVFPTEFFSDGMIKATWERLLLWAGFAGVLLMKSESQISGVSPSLLLQLRAKVAAFQEDWVDFLSSIFNSPDFQGENEIDLTPAFSKSHLYTVDELQKLVVMHTRAASMAPQSIREDLLDLDNEREGGLMEESHKNPKLYVPVFESNQGIGPALFPDEYPGSSSGGVSGKPGESAPGPGRPSTSGV